MFEINKPPLRRLNGGFSVLPMNISILMESSLSSLWSKHIRKKNHCDINVPEWLSWYCFTSVSVSEDLEETRQISFVKQFHCFQCLKLIFLRIMVFFATCFLTLCRPIIIIFIKKSSSIQDVTKVHEYPHKRPSTRYWFFILETRSLTRDDTRDNFRVGIAKLLN